MNTHKIAQSELSDIKKSEPIVIFVESLIKRGKDKLRIVVNSLEKKLLMPLCLNEVKIISKSITWN